MIQLFTLPVLFFLLASCTALPVTDRDLACLSHGVRGMTARVDSVTNGRRIKAAVMITRYSAAGWLLTNTVSNLRDNSVETEEYSIDYSGRPLAGKWSSAAGNGLCTNIYQGHYLREKIYYENSNIVLRRVYHTGLSGILDREDIYGGDDDVLESRIYRYSGGRLSDIFTYSAKGLLILHTHHSWNNGALRMTVKAEQYSGRTNLIYYSRDNDIPDPALAVRFNQPEGTNGYLEYEYTYH